MDDFQDGAKSKMSYTPPNTDQFELALIRTALEPHLAQQVFSLAVPEHFANESLRKVFHRARAIHFAGNSLTEETLKLALRATESDEVVVEDWVGSVMAVQPSAGAEYVVQLLASSRQKQLIYELGASLTSQAMAGKPPEVALSEINKFASAQHTLTGNKFETLYDALSRVAGRREPPTILVPKMGALDNLMRFRKGSFSIIAADSGGGKSSMMINLMVNLAKQGHPTACASIEMNNDELAVRAGAILAGLDSERVEDGLLNPTELEHLLYVIKENEHVLSIMHVMDPFSLDVDAVGGILNDAIVKFQIKAFFLDYLQKCQAKGPLIHSQTDRVGYVSETLTADAKRTGIPIIALSQFSRGTGEKGMSNLKQSSQIEHDAHSIYILRQDGDDIDGVRYLDCDAVKNRKGKRGSEQLAFHLSSQRIEHSGRSWQDVKAEKKSKTNAPF